MAQEQQESLFSGFEATSTEAWKEKVLKDLKGKAWESLQWTPYEGITLDPFYRREDLERSANGLDSLPGEFPFRRGNVFNADHDGWQVIQEVPIVAGSQIPTLIQEAQRHEVYAFFLQSEGAIEDLESFFEYLDFDQAALHLAFPNVPALLSLDLYTVLNQKGIKAESLTGTLLNDPISMAAAKGKTAFKSDFAMIEAGVQNFSASPYFRGVGLDLSYVHEQGGSAVQEIAFALGTLVEYMDLVEKTQSEIYLEELLKNLAFTFSVGNNFFMEIAKFRAFRLLYAQVMKAYRIDDEQLSSPFIIGKTATFNLSLYDTYNNLLRNTSAALSGILGGVQGMVIRPFDRLHETVNPNSLRLARNIQHLLRHESHLNEVIDPSGGSYYIEKLTDALGQEAWKSFQEMESKGGFSELLAQGRIQEMLLESRSKKERALAIQKESLIGVNVYPNTEEVMDKTLVEDDRLASPLETIRLKADALARQRGKRLSAFLLLFGEARSRNARAQFARNLLGSGGFEIQENSKLEDLMASLKEAIEARAEVLVLCASNEDYEQEAKGICDQVKASNYQPLILQAGKTANWEKSGVDDVIYLGMDAFDFLEKVVRNQA